MSKKEGKVLICIIEDNGIGREQSRKLKEASVMKHKSMGMKITEDRIKAMGRVKGSQVEIQDLKDGAGNAAGTRVIIRLPYKSM
jgi:LytS/YehU family sensor histidine kinase